VQWLDGGVQVPGPGEAAAWDALEAAAAHIQQHLSGVHCAEDTSTREPAWLEGFPVHGLYSSQQWERICSLLQEQQPTPFSSAMLSNALTAAPAAAFAAERACVSYLVAALAAAAVQVADLQQQQQHQYSKQGQQHAGAAGAARRGSFRERIEQLRLQQAATAIR
jgi:hypothetical protein